MSTKKQKKEKKKKGNYTHTHIYIYISHTHNYILIHTTPPGHVSLFSWKINKGRNATKRIVGY